MWLVDARKTSLTGVQNSQKKSARRYAARGRCSASSLDQTPPLGKKLDPPLITVSHKVSRPLLYFIYRESLFAVLKQCHSTSIYRHLLCCLCLFDYNDATRTIISCENSIYYLFISSYLWTHPAECLPRQTDLRQHILPEPTGEEFAGSWTVVH